MTKKILIDEAVVQEALFRLNGWAQACGCNADTDACNDLREALEVNNKGVNALAEQPAQQEPVAWISEVRCVGPEYGKKRYGALPIQSLQPGYYAHTPLYASPQPSKPLTDEQISEIVTVSTGWTVPLSSHYSLARAIEAAHGITSTNQGE